MLTAQKAFCAAEAISSDLKPALKSSANEPNFLSVLSALLFVVALIYVTGLIYSKLNVVGAKTVQTQIRNNDLSRAVVISTTQLGQNKNLHVIELNKKHYLIGSTPGSINLIKELGSIKEVEITTEKSQPETKSDNDIETVYVEEQPNFDLHKKYLR